MILTLGFYDFVVMRFVSCGRGHNRAVRFDYLAVGVFSSTWVIIWVLWGGFGADSGVVFGCCYVLMVVS